MHALSPAELYEALAPLHPGASVPAHVHVADYRDGGRPRWTVVERQELEHGGVVLALTDPDNRDLFDEARVIIIAFPRKVLRTPIQPHSADAPARVGNKLCDLAQQGRYAAKEAHRCPDYG